MAGLSLNPYDLNYGQFTAGAQPVGAPVAGTGTDTGYFPPTPGSNPAAAYFQQNPEMAQSGLGAVLNSMGGPKPPGSGLGTGLGMNLGTGQLALGALGTIGNLWMAWNAQKLAQKQFDYQKGITNTNLANQIKSYNTALSDRITSRAAYMEEGQDYVNDYLNDNRLRDERKNKG